MAVFVLLGQLVHLNAEVLDVVVLQVKVLALQFALDDGDFVYERGEFRVIAVAEADVFLLLGLEDDVFDLLGLVVDHVLNLALHLEELVPAVFACVEDLLELRQLVLHVLGDLSGGLKDFLLGL